MKKRCVIVLGWLLMSVWLLRGQCIGLAFQELENDSTGWTPSTEAVLRETGTVSDPSEAQLIQMVIDSGWVDATDQLGVPYMGSEALAVSKFIFPDRLQLFYYDKVQGRFTHDSLVCATSDAQWANDCDFYRKRVERADVIVDATCIEVERYRLKNGSRFSNHYLLVHHWIKGKTKRKIVSTTSPHGATHGSSLPGKGGRGVIFLKRSPTRTVRSPNPQKAQRYEYWQLQRSQHAEYGTFQYHQDILSGIAQYSKDRVRYAMPAVPPDAIVSSWLHDQGLEKLKNREGLVLDLKRMYWHRDGQEIHALLMANSYRDYVQLMNKAFLVEYDTAVVGSFAARHGRVAVSRLTDYAGHQKLRKPKALLGPAYEIELEDVAANQIRVKIRVDDPKDAAELRPKRKDGKMQELMKLCFQVKDTFEATYFQIALLDEAYPVHGRYRQPRLKLRQPFAFQWNINKEVRLELNKRPAK